ncbi:hypothetical protein ANN_02919 [Periplaneta americana]|uniref:DUF659 domain-containing protein n=1 Tax=Periplaneta americana TaxID=6978 RepID=A0ABQ8U0P4_PERAM|nr:hypothetical protein ANN_02919 [Periplaneta americana]
MVRCVFSGNISSMTDSIETENEIVFFYFKGDGHYVQSINEALDAYARRQVHDMVEENKTKWKDHVDRMAENRLPKKIMNYRPIGKRDLGRPRKRWLDDRDRNRLTVDEIIAIVKEDNNILVADIFINPPEIIVLEKFYDISIIRAEKKKENLFLVSSICRMTITNMKMLHKPLIKDFSCAAQQLNASQSTHRFSFVNHTIKTVNMPKVRHSVNLKSKLTSYISEFKEDGLSTDNKILFCNLCQCAVSSTQKFLVQQHITTSKHQANKQLNSKQRQLFLTQPTTSNVRSEFNIDLCRSLISADIPLYKLKNKVFREFLEKYTQHTIPDESTLRKTYAPSIYDETIQKIRDEIKDSSIWVSIDETPDKEGRLVGNVVIGLLSEQYSERILLHCDVLEKCNNKTIVKLFNEAMGILWPKGIMYDNVLFFISDAAPYMVKAGQALSVVYPKLTHFTCVAHAFHRVAEVVRDNFPKVDLLISSVKKYFSKLPVELTC